MANIVILGAGVMGSAFSVPLADNGHQVRLVGTHLDGDIIEELHESGVHPRLRVKLSPTVQPYTYDCLAKAMVGAELVVLGVNSLGVDWASQMLGNLLPADFPVVLLTKGLVGAGQALQILPEALRAGFPPARQQDVRVAAIGGPSIAGELAVRRHTCVMVTSAHTDLLDRLVRLLRTSYYHVWPNTDVIGVEVCVALKNIYALAVGLVGGLLEKEGQAEHAAAMHNVAAAIFAQGVGETAYLVEHMGGQRATVISLPGSGDLYVTCQGGRNSRMGRWLGLGTPYSKAKARYMPTETIEGAELALAIGPTIATLCANGTLDWRRLPLLHSMIQIVCHDAPVVIPWEKFFQ